MSGDWKGSGRDSSMSVVFPLRSMKKSGLGGFKGGSRFAPVSGAEDVDIDEVDEIMDGAVGGRDIWEDLGDDESGGKGMDSAPVH